MYDTIRAFVGVQYSVNFQNGRCNNKDNLKLCLFIMQLTIIFRNAMGS
jgi:hypothetical protein